MVKMEFAFYMDFYPDYSDFGFGYRFNHFCFPLNLLYYFRNYFKNRYRYYAFVHFCPESWVLLFALEFFIWLAWFPILCLGLLIPQKFQNHFSLCTNCTKFYDLHQFYVTPIRDLSQDTTFQIISSLLSGMSECLKFVFGFKIKFVSYLLLKHFINIGVFEIFVKVGQCSPRNLIN